MVHSAGAEFAVAFFTFFLYWHSFWFRIPGHPYGIAAGINSKYSELSLLDSGFALDHDTVDVHF